MPTHGIPYRFRGFRSPRYTQVPDEAFDELMAELTPAEFKVMMYIIRRTFGFKKDYDAISLSQIVGGLTTADGRVLDRGTGLSKSGTVKAIKGLLDKNVILAQTRTSAERGHEPTVYQLNFADGQPSFPGPDDLPSIPLVHSVDKGGLSTQRTSPSPPSAQGLVHSEDIQDTDVQDTEHLSLMALDFLRAIGYKKPSKAKRERALRIMKGLLDDDYTTEDVEAACGIAASLGARGPELIPHVIGQAPEAQVEAEVGERVAREEAAAHDRWQEQSDHFDALPEDERDRLIQAAQESNRILAQRPPDHPLVRAAAVAMLE